MKVLVVRVGRLGDLVMITPALDALLEANPAAQLTLLTSPEGSRVLRGFDARLGEIWTYDRRRLLPFLERRRLARRIRDGGFERVYLFESNPTYARLVERSGAVVNGLPHGGDRVVHFAERCLAAVGVEPGRHWARVPVDEDARRRARQTLAQAGIGDDDTLVGFHPSFSGLRRADAAVRRHKTWPVEHWGELARRVTDATTVRVVMDLEEEDRPLGEAIARASGGAVTALYPPADFERYKATLERMDLLIAPDTGPMHLAAAVGTPVVALFSGKDPADCGPYAPPERCAALRAEDHGGYGLESLPLEIVLQAALALLSNR